MRPLRVDLQAILLASLGLVSVLIVCCTVLDPRFLAVRTYLAPFRDRLLAQVELSSSSVPVLRVVSCLPSPLSSDWQL
jgi:hypothetical protein